MHETAERRCSKSGPRKLQAYLLSLTHPIGSSKAKFFRKLGFAGSDVAFLEQALKELARTQEVVTVAPSPHGVTYIVDGLLPTPSGIRVQLRTIWIVGAEETSPRFVTAYPV